jgi:hypothetical protein
MAIVIGVDHTIIVILEKTVKKRALTRIASFGAEISV